MGRHICLLNQHEGELLREGVELCCRDHQHIDRRQARLLTLGAEKVPYLDPDFVRTYGEISERFKPSACWAKLPDGRSSERHLVVFAAREWTMSQRWLPVGVERRAKFGKTKISRGQERMSAAAVNYVPPGRLCVDQVDLVD